MFRVSLGLGLVAVAFSLAGCRMCQHPYDYSGPVYDSGCGSCGMHSRAGSILDGASSYDVYGPALREPQAPERYVKSKPAPSKPQKPQRVAKTVPPQADPQDQPQYGKGVPPFGIVPGSERIISITERVVEPAATSEAPAQVAEESSPAPGSPGALPASGWTARRLEPESQR